MDAAKRKAVLETLKSVGRGLWFGILGLVVVALTAIVSSGNISDMGVTVAGFTVNYSVIILAVASYAIKLLDTYIHNNKTIDSQGLAPAFLQSTSSTATPVPAVAPYVPPAAVVQPEQVITPTQPTAPAEPAETAEPAQVDETPAAEPLPWPETDAAPTINQPLGS